MWRVNTWDMMKFSMRVWDNSHDTVQLLLYVSLLWQKIHHHFSLFAITIMHNKAAVLLSFLYTFLENILYVRPPDKYRFFFFSLSLFLLQDKEPCAYRRIIKTGRSPTGRLYFNPTIYKETKPLGRKKLSILNKF